MRRQIAGFIVVFLCTISSLAAQTIQFGARQDIQTGATHLVGLAVADFNGDKKLDIAVTDDYSQTVSVYLNDGTGKFGSPITSTFAVPSIGGFGAIVVGDVNEDGKQDLIVGPIAGLQYDIVLLGNGDGTFTEKGQITTSYGFESAALIDINGDKHLDLIAGGNGSLYVHLGDGQGNFSQEPLTGYQGGGLYTGVTVGDFNGDKLLDFVSLSYSNSQLRFFPGNGDGTFKQSSTLTVPNLFSPASIASADFNGDGKLDLLVGSSDVAFLVAGNGDGTFQLNAPSALPLPDKTNFSQGISPLVAAADMNGDGKIDAIAADDGSDTLSVLLNDGTGKFSQSISATLDDGSGAIQVGDLNGDGLPDVVLINYKTQKISFFLSAIVKTTPTVSIQSSAAQALVGSSVTITVQVKPSASNTPTGTVTLTSGTTSYGQQTLNTSGQVNFTLPSLAVGQYPLFASYAGDTYNNSATNTSTFVQDSTDFQFSLSSSTQTVATGAAATYNSTVTPTAGFVGPVNFSCVGLPAGYTCSAQTVTVTGQGVNSPVIVSPPLTASGSAKQLPFQSGATTSFLALGGICFYLRRRRISQLFLCIVALAACSAAIGCGGSNSGSKPSGYKGTSNFTITASTTQGGITVSHQVSATLTVQ